MSIRDNLRDVVEANNKFCEYSIYERLVTERFIRPPCLHGAVRVRDLLAQLGETTAFFVLAANRSNSVRAFEILTRTLSPS